MLPIDTDKSGQDESPFYSTAHWFNELKDNVFKDNQRVDLFSGTHRLPHIVSQENILFLHLKKLRSLSNYYSPEFIPIGCINTDEANCTFQFYSRNDLKKYDCVDIDPLSEKNADELVAHFSSLGFFCEKYKVTTNWTHPHIASVESFWELRPNKMKNILKSKRIKLERSQEYNVQILSSNDAELYAKMIVDYHDVYKKSWKNDEPYNDFINKITREELNKGKLRLGVVYHNNIAVASQIWFIHLNTAYIFKLSYDNNYRTESVGSILMEAMFNHVIDKDKVTTIDFLTGDDPYKADWMSESRPLFGVKAYNKSSFKGLVATFAIQLNKVIKKTLRPGH